KVSKNKNIALVGTKATINSKKYDSELKKLAPEIKLFSKACPLLVPFIEENWHRKPEATSILKKYLRPIKTKNIDTLILGCTHYPLMKKSFERIMGKKVKIISSGEITAKSLVKYLVKHSEIEGKLSKKSTRTFLTT